MADDASFSALKAQYFLAFAVAGSTQPFLSVFLSQDGLSRPQVGYVLASASVAIVLTPVVTTLLADTRLDPRRLMAGLFILGGAAFLAMFFAHGFVPLLILCTIQSLALVPSISLQDGMNFTAQNAAQRDGLRHPPYHRVRAYGSVGFILPSIILFFFLWHFEAARYVLPVGAVFCVIGALNTFRLPQACVPRIDPNAPPDHSRLPTLAAARAMCRRDIFVFSAAMFLIGLSSTAYYGFYPIYLTERIGVTTRWVGVITNLGVAIEIFFMLGFGWLQAKLGLRWLAALSASCLVVRMTLLAAWPIAAVAVGTQVLHGMIVLLIHVMPSTYMNRHAGDAYRNSMQGVFAMAVTGSARIVGSLIAGQIAAVSLAAVFTYGALVALAAAVMFALVFRESAGVGRQAGGDGLR